MQARSLDVFCLSLSYIDKIIVYMTISLLHLQVWVSSQS